MWRARVASRPAREGLRTSRIAPRGLLSTNRPSRANPRPQTPRKRLLGLVHEVVLLPLDSSRAKSRCIPSGLGGPRSPSLYESWALLAGRGTRPARRACRRVPRTLGTAGRLAGPPAHRRLRGCAWERGPGTHARTTSCARPAGRVRMGLGALMPPSRRCGTSRRACVRPGPSAVAPRCRSRSTSRRSARRPARRGARAGTPPRT